jgi:DNA-binding MarR family transcriptional regulator
LCGDQYDIVDRPDCKEPGLDLPERVRREPAWDHPAVIVAARERCEFIPPSRLPSLIPGDPWGGDYRPELVGNGKDDRVNIFKPEEAVRLRQGVTRLARKLSSTASSEALSPTEASILAQITVRGPIGAAELMEIEYINRSMLSRLVTRLEKDGLVAKRQREDDLRAVDFEITEEGRRVSELVREHRTALIMEGLARLTPEQQEVLRAAVPVIEDLADAVVVPNARHRY